MLDALIFDVDGTVAETEDLHRRAFNLALARHGVDIAWDPREYRRLLQVHGGKERLQRSLAEHETPRSRDEIAAIHATKTALYESMLAAEGAPWRPGVARLMGEALRRGLRLAIATTTTAANLEPLFAPVIGRDWRLCFSAVLAGDVVAHKKPAPDIYRECVQRLGTRPQACIAFEDSAAGVTSARAPGAPRRRTPASSARSATGSRCGPATPRCSRRASPGCSGGRRRRTPASAPGTRPSRPP